MIDFAHDIERIRELAEPVLSFDRRSRVALEAALECLRFRWGGGGTWRVTEEDADRSLVDACDALTVIGTECVQRFGEALPRERRRRGHLVGSTRVLRARLALVLRAVLRAERGEELFTRCRGVRSLWETAPAHDGRTPHERRGART